MAADIVDFVKEIRLVYRQCYMDHTLRAKYGESMRLRAEFRHNGQMLGFPGCEIVVSFTADSHEVIWAQNIFRELTAGNYRAYILAGEEVANLPWPLKKFVLAQEFLEVALGFRDPGRRQRRRIHGRIELVELYNTMCRRTLWQDSTDEQIEMHRGLRYLLVSSETIERTIVKDFGIPIAQLKGLMRDSTQANLASDILGRIERAIASRRNVDRELVRDRLDEMLNEII